MNLTKKLKRGDSMKKNLFLVISALAVVLSFTSCGKKAEKSADGQTLKLAVVETAYGAQKWHQVVAAFEELNPGVKVELTIDKKLEDLIDPSIKAGKYPDVIMRAVGGAQGFTEKFVKGKQLENLDSVLAMNVPGESVKVGDKILNGFVDNATCQPYGDGKTYLMPMFYSPCGLFYDADLLADNGWTVPQTWDEMWELGDKAKAKGISLFTYPTSGYFDAFLYALLHETMGPAMYDKAMNFAEGIWETPEAKQAFDIIAKLTKYTEPTTPANANDSNFTKNQQLILDGKALFMPNGTWVVGEMANAPRRDGFKWGFTALPAVKKGGERASFGWFEQVWMPSQAKNKDLGKEFIAFLYSDKAGQIFAKATEDGGPAIQPIFGLAEKLSGDDKMFYSIYDTGATAVMSSFAKFDPIPGVSVRTTFLEPVDSLVTGDKSLDEYIAQIVKDSDKMRANLKKN